MASFQALWLLENSVVLQRRNGIDDIVAEQGVEFLEGQVEVSGFFDFSKECGCHKVDSRG